MDVFLSWSGSRSRVVAEALHSWLPQILPSLQPWISTRDVRIGSRAIPSIENALRGCRVGILCVTTENQTAPWIHFEAGALARAGADALVCPYMIGFQPHELLAPLATFQAATATESGTFELLTALNHALGTDGISQQRLKQRFCQRWESLQAILDSVSKVDTGDGLASHSQRDALSSHGIAEIAADRTLNTQAVDKNPPPDLDELIERYAIMSTEEIRIALEQSGIDLAQTANTIKHLIDRLAGAESRSRKSHDGLARADRVIKDWHNLWLAA